MRGNYTAALNDNTLGMHLLGVDVNAAPTRREADIMFEQYPRWERRSHTVVVEIRVLGAVP